MTDQTLLDLGAAKQKGTRIKPTSKRVNIHLINTEYFDKMYHIAMNREARRLERQTAEQKHADILASRETVVPDFLKGDFDRADRASKVGKGSENVGINDVVRGTVNDSNVANSRRMNALAKSSRSREGSHKGILEVLRHNEPVENPIAGMTAGQIKQYMIEKNAAKVL